MERVDVMSRHVEEVFTVLHAVAGSSRDAWVVGIH